MKKNAFYAQSGGVTSVINATASALILESKKYKSKIGKVYAGKNGILGALREDLIDTSKENISAIKGLRETPGGVFGSCRFKLKSLEDKLANHLRKIDKCKMQVQLIIPTEPTSYDKIKDKIEEYDDKYDTGTMFALIKPDIVSKIRILQVERKLKLEIKLRELRNKDIANKMDEEYKGTKTILDAKINKGRMLEEGRNKIDKISNINN